MARPLVMGELTIPYYFSTLDFDGLIREYPPPPAFFEGMFYRWDRADIQRVQEERFLKEVRRAWEIPFYRRRWTEAGISPDDIRGLADLRRIPLYDVDDVRAGVERRPPFGDYQAFSLQDARKVPLRIFTSGGTTGRARPMIYSQRDWEIYTILMARIFYLHGARPGDVAQLPMTFGLHVGSFAGEHAVRRWLGCVPITTSSGSVTPSRRQIEIAREWGTTFFMGPPDYFLHLAQVAREMGVDIQRDLKVRLMSIGGDPRPVEDAWGCPCYDFFGANEYGMISAECQERQGLHIWEDAVIAETVDVDSGEPVGPGEKGNLVITALYKDGAPVIRYNTKDLTRLFDAQPCACGSWFRRMDHILGRSDTMVRLRGTNVWPEACGEVVRMDRRVTGEYYCIVERAGQPPHDRDEMTIIVEYKDNVSDQAALKKDLEEALRAHLDVSIKVELAQPSSLARLTGYGTEPKIKRFEDRRSKGEK